MQLYHHLQRVDDVSPLNLTGRARVYLSYQTAVSKASWAKMVLSQTP